MKRGTPLSRGTSQLKRTPLERRQRVKPFNAKRKAIASSQLALVVWGRKVKA